MALLLVPPPQHPAPAGGPVDGVRDGDGVGDGAVDGPAGGVVAGPLDGPLDGPVRAARAARATTGAPRPTAAAALLRRAARPAAGAVGVAALLAVLAGAALSTAPAPDRTLPADAPVVGLTGARALQPDVLGPPPADPLTADPLTTGSGTTTGSGPDRPVVAGPAPAPTAAPCAGTATTGCGAGAAGTPSARPPAAPVAVVRRFFAALPERPDAALALLDPALRAGAAEGFRRSWRAADEVERVDVRPDAPGRVRTDVVVRRHDGARLRTEHLVDVAGGPTAPITGAVLLSAQEMPALAR